MDVVGGGEVSCFAVRVVKFRYEEWGRKKSVPVGLYRWTENLKAMVL